MLGQVYQLIVQFQVNLIICLLLVVLFLLVMLHSELLFLLLLKVLQLVVLTLQHSRQYLSLITAESLSLSWVTTVTDILSVTIKEPLSYIGDSTVTVQIYPASNCDSSSCSIEKTVSGYDSSCSRTYDCDRFSCVEPGDYFINVDVTNLYSQSFEIQVVNQWVDLSSSVSASMIGEHKHFYRVPNSDSALSFSLEIASGPALKWIVFDGFQVTVIMKKVFALLVIATFTFLLLLFIQVLPLFILKLNLE